MTKQECDEAISNNKLVYRYFSKVGSFFDFALYPHPLTFEYLKANPKAKSRWCSISRKTGLIKKGV